VHAIRVPVLKVKYLNVLISMGRILCSRLLQCMQRMINL
jgi:hypothetical protein